MKIENFPCPVCDSNDYHQNGLDENKTLVVCKNCGAVWHSRDNTKEAGLLEFYRKDYRTAPDHHNLIYSQNKLMYIERFLHEWLDGKKGLVCTDVGCATGYVPNWLRKLGHRATGTEYTVSFRRFAEFFYGIPVSEEIEKKHKYDLISYYHVLEHMFRPDEKLKEARECLSDNGRIMVSVPRFLHLYDEPSTNRVPSFDNFFHKNHINLFTLQSIRNLFAKVGLVVEKENLEMYGMTFLLKKGEVGQINKENWEENNAIIIKHKEAWDEFAKGNFKKAMDIYPLFTGAWTSFIMQTIGKDPERQADVWNEVFSNPELAKSNKLRMAYAFWLQNHEKYDEAEKAFAELFERKPNADWLFQRGICLTLLKRHKEAMMMFRQAAMMQPIRWAEAMDWCAKNACSMPCWEEMAVEQVKERIFRENRDQIEIMPKDPVMENNGK